MDETTTAASVSNEEAKEYYVSIFLDKLGHTNKSFRNFK